MFTGTYFCFRSPACMHFHSISVFFSLNTHGFIVLPGCFWSMNINFSLTYTVGADSAILVSPVASYFGFSYFYSSSLFSSPYSMSSSSSLYSCYVPSSLSFFLFSSSSFFSYPFSSPSALPPSPIFHLRLTLSLFLSPMPYLTHLPCIFPYLLPFPSSSLFLHPRRWWGCRRWVGQRLADEDTDDEGVVVFILGTPEAASIYGDEDTKAYSWYQGPGGYTGRYTRVYRYHVGTMVPSGCRYYGTIRLQVPWYHPAAGTMVTSSYKYHGTIRLQVPWGCRYHRADVSGVMEWGCWRRPHLLVEDIVIGLAQECRNSLWDEGIQTEYITS